MDKASFSTRLIPEVIWLSSPARTFARLECECIGRIIASATSQRAPIQLPDLLNEPLSLVLNLVIHAGYRALLVVPLLRPGGVIGTLVLRRKQPGEFSNDTVDLLETFAD